MKTSFKSSREFLKLSDHVKSHSKNGNKAKEFDKYTQSWSY